MILEHFGAGGERDQHVGRGQKRRGQGNSRKKTHRRRRSFSHRLRRPKGGCGILPSVLGTRRRTEMSRKTRDNVSGDRDNQVGWRQADSLAGSNTPGTGGERRHRRGWCHRSFCGACAELPPLSVAFSWDAGPELSYSTTASFSRDLPASAGTSKRTQRVMTDSRRNQNDK